MRKYDSYKSSDIEWLDTLPYSWNTRRIKDISSVISKGTTPSTEGEAYTDFGVRYIKAENIIENGTVSELPAFFISDKTNKLLARSILKSNDLLMVIAGATTGKVAVIKNEQLPANTNQAVCFIRLHNSEKINLRFKYYFLNSSFLQSQVWLYAVTSAQPNLPMAVLSRFHICYPPLIEQTAIAQYLDTKTQAIDKKVNLLEKKIGYYKELRKSIINETVTKGLDKNVKLKDSGIYYISSIPEHWLIQRIKDKFKIGRGRVISQEELIEEGMFPVYSSQTENNGCLGYINSYDFDKDLLTWTTDGANAGTVFRRKGKFNCTNVCGTLIPIRMDLDLDFMVYALQESATHNKRIDTNGAKIMNNEMAVIQVTFPPIEEQTAIATYLDHKTQTIDKIVTNIQKQIATLKELRKTLINDVVTGKIKVVE